MFHYKEPCKEQKALNAAETPTAVSYLCQKARPPSSFCLTIMQHSDQHSSPIHNEFIDIAHSCHTCTGEARRTLPSTIHSGRVQTQSSQRLHKISYIELH
ncbi:hypothetical protein ATANTOWER_013357 [Ataeniobius toweri]|uniref:Uncharacterized protein n=1 Tax=Ataeniobius toweri TaxID=208326 RepID=A0ABU7BT27_9TELE|nr:hypothetical protein [Ataeniobius toweri]